MSSPHPDIVLASASPRRAHLLRQIGLPFRQIPCLDEEQGPTDVGAATHATQVARSKARSVAASIESDSRPAFVVAADTVVYLDGDILGKPRDRADAVRMLRALSGRPHQVYTGVCILSPDGREMEGCRCTEVAFAPISDADIEWYVDCGEPMDKAGSYGIQGAAARFVERIEGCYYNVVGLPLSLVANLLRAAGYNLNQHAAGPT